MRGRDKPRCKACGAPIDFIKTEHSRIPVDPIPLLFEPDEEGPEVLVRENGKTVRCRLTPDAPVWDPWKVGYRSHFSTCPDGDKMRRKRAEGAASTRRAEKAARQAEIEAAGEQLTFQGE